MCGYGSGITQHFLRSSLFFNHERKHFFESLHDIKLSLLEFQKDFLTNKLLFGSSKFEETINRKAIWSTITYLKASSGFEGLLIDQ